MVALLKVTSELESGARSSVVVKGKIVSDSVGEENEKEGVGISDNREDGVVGSGVGCTDDVSGAKLS